MHVHLVSSTKSRRRVFIEAVLDDARIIFASVCADFGAERFDLRHCRYIELAKTRLQHVLTAVALNIVRLEAWWTGQPLAKTRISRFAALQLSAA